MKSLKDRVFDVLDKPRTIPWLCQKFNVSDEYKIMHCIAELEDEGRAVLSGFDRFYEPDGSAGYLAQYEQKR